jgi:hypothetical protein
MDFKISSDLWPDRPSDSVPSIFRRRKILVGRRKRDQSGKIGKRIRIPRHSTGTSAAANPPVDSGAVIVIDGETDEQRLPLKKRHHHMQRDGGGKQQHLDEIEIEIEIGTVSPVKSAAPTPPTATAVTTMQEKDDIGAVRGTLLAARSVEGVYRTSGKAADILSPSKMPPHRSFVSGNILLCIFLESVFFVHLYRPSEGTAVVL